VGPSRARDLTLDTGALIAVERSAPRVVLLLAETMDAGREIHLPAGVVGQAWRGGGRQARLARLLQSPRVKVHPLDLPVALAVGVLASASGVADVIDCHVALVARSTGSKVLTSDTADLSRIDPSLVLEAV